MRAIESKLSIQTRPGIGAIPFTVSSSRNAIICGHCLTRVEGESYRKDDTEKRGKAEFHDRVSGDVIRRKDSDGHSLWQPPIPLTQSRPDLVLLLCPNPGPDAGRVPGSLGPICQRRTRGSNSLGVSGPPGHGKSIFL